MNKLQTKKGFTIIEVVLVLAIAGLIFLMVFIALPALQKGQRDNQRRQDVGTIVSQLNSYATNNRGALPANTDAAFTTFMSSYAADLRDPKTGDAYTRALVSVTGSATLPEGQIQYKRNAQCDGENATATGTARQAAVRVRLEGAGHYCQDVNG